MNIETKSGYEILLDIEGYEGIYKVSNLGNVFSFDRKVGFYNKPTSIISPNDNGFGYLAVSLAINGKNKSFYIHRLVACAFLENKGQKCQVNHIDGIKFNNNVENLEWCTRKENMKHAVENGLYTNTCSKEIMCVETGEIYESAVSASKHFGVVPSAIRNVLNGYNKTCRGKTFVHTQPCHLSNRK